MKKIKANDLNPHGAIVTFIDDNGDKSFLNTWKPILDAKGIKMGVAVITGSVGTGNYMTIEELQNLQSQGIEIYSHTVTHPNDWTILTTQQIIDECKNSQDFLKQNGFDGYDILVYPSGLSSTNYTVNYNSK